MVLRMTAAAPLHAGPEPATGDVYAAAGRLTPRPAATRHAWLAAHLAALRAGAEMAEHEGDTEFAERCRALFTFGRAWMDDHLFNGEYYEHHIVPATRAAEGIVLDGTSDKPGEPQMQLGSGCLIDQLVGQFLAHVGGLGHLHDPAKVHTTLTNVVRHNRRSGFYDHNNVMRSYVLGDETAVLMASYPHGERPGRPFSYFTEVMTGFEYTLAAGLGYEGDEVAALAIVRDIRERYDGYRRSPWNEAECGHHYARAMASWGAVLALSGFHYAADEYHLRFAARQPSQVFWSNGYACGARRARPGATTSPTESRSRRRSGRGRGRPGAHPGRP